MTGYKRVTPQARIDVQVATVVKAVQLYELREIKELRKWKRELLRCKKQDARALKVVNIYIQKCKGA